MNSPINSFRKTIALEEVDQIPVIPMMGGWIANFSGIPLKTLIYDGEAIVEAQVKAQEALGHDALFAYIDALHIPEAFGCPIGTLSTGAVEATPLDLQTEADIDALPLPDVRQAGRLPLMLAVAEKLVRLPERAVPVLPLVEGPFTTCARIMGTEKMVRAVLKNRSLVERLLEKLGIIFARFGEALEQSGVDGLIIADPMSSGTVVSPKVYRELAFPHLQHFIEGLKIPVILHVCGNTELILDPMTQTGARILSLDQCMDLVAARQKVASRCGIGGNVHPIDVLLHGTVEDVEQDTLRCLREGGRKGYMLMAGCAVPPATPMENLKAMIGTARLRGRNYTE